MTCPTCPNQSQPMGGKIVGVRQPALGELSAGWWLGLMLLGSIGASLLWNLMIPSAKEVEE